jgi:hypothetical protein
MFHGLVISMPGSHSSTSPYTSSLPSATTPQGWEQVSLIISGAFLWRVAFGPFWFKQRAAFQLSFSLVNVSWEQPFYLAYWPLLWLPRLLLTWVVVGQSLGPWFWDSWPPLSFALLDQPPPPDHLENHLTWVDSIKVIPLACWRMSLEHLVGTCEFLATLVTLSLQLWN